MDISIEKKDLIPFVAQAMDELRSWLDEKKRQYGDRYNAGNKWEKVVTMGATAFVNRYLDEYYLMQAKKSKLPASVRNVVKPVFDRAVWLFYQDWEKKNADQKTQEK